ncbi:MAG: ribonuclease J [Firmicutes bacterium]|nr:ribonuclease J [Candidatus Fiminaster equi]
MDKIRIITLGGLDELYKNMTLVEVNDEIYVIECGVKFPDKTKPGVDYIIPRFDYLLANKSKVKGYFLTHGHDSIIGALPYIYDRVPAPIYCTNTTKTFFCSFCVHNHIDYRKYSFVIVKPSDDIRIGNRLISLFSTCCNFAESFGVSISTDQGNIIYLSNFVINNDNVPGFTNDFAKLGRICDQKTLVLLMDAEASEKPGYCAPNYRLISLIKKELFDINGRAFLAIDTPDLFNIIDVINKANKYAGRKIIPYDESSRELITNLMKSGYLKVDKNSILSIEDVNRINPKELLIFITGFGAKLNSKVALLASRNNDEKIVFLTEKDTFIFANHITPENEVSTTDALDELYHNDCKIIRVKKDFVRMHAQEEDIKQILSFIRPKYFVPISGSFKQLLAAAKLAVSMNVGLNHNSIFVVDNGNILEFEAGFGKLSSNKVISGDLLVDGKGIGDIQNEVIEERQKFSDDGVIILAATISKSKHQIVAGPDVQSRGLVFLKDNEPLMKEITRLFISTIEMELAKEHYSISYLEEATKDIVFKAIRRSLNKTPIILPIFAEIE